MVLGKKQIEKLSGFTGSFIGFGIAAFISVVYLTDWKVICAYIPFYNTKFPEKPKE